MPAPSPLSPAPEPRHRMPWLRVGIALVLLISVSVLAVWGARVQGAMAAYEAEMAAWLDEVAGDFEHVPVLTEAERGLLRRSLNRRHVALAEALGIPPAPTRDTLAAVAEARGLIRVDRPSPYYEADDARFSLAYLTPAAAASLDTLGAHFQARADAAGLPRYRVVVTSILRSAEDQAALRGRNANAAAGHSSHEYGTTYDVHYRRFAYAGPGRLAPPEPPEALPAFVRLWLREHAGTAREATFRDFADRYPARLEALLGRTLIALEDEGVLVTVMERGQPVFHTTVARDLAETNATEAR